MRTIVLMIGFLLIVPLRYATADDISLLEKYLPKSTNLQMTQSCQYDNPCNQKYSECREKCSDTSCTYNCCINFKNCQGAHSCNILYIQCFNY
jgi:hypothetical protein